MCEGKIAYQLEFLALNSKLKRGTPPGMLTRSVGAVKFDVLLVNSTGFSTCVLCRLQKIFHLEELEIVHLAKIEELEADISDARNLSHASIYESGGDDTLLEQEVQNSSFASNAIDSSFNSSFNDSFGPENSDGTRLMSSQQPSTHRNVDHSDRTRDTNSYPIVVPDNEGFSANTSTCIKNLSFSSVVEDDVPSRSRAHISLLSTPEPSYTREDSNIAQRFDDDEGSSGSHSRISDENSSVGINTNVTQSSQHNTLSSIDEPPKFPSPSSLNIENLRSLTADDLAPLPQFRIQTPPRAHHRRVRSYAPTSAPRRPSTHRVRALTHIRGSDLLMSSLTHTPGRPFVSSRRRRAPEARSHGLGLSHSRTQSSVDGSASMQPQRALFHSHISPKDISRQLAQDLNVPLAQSSFADALPPENQGERSFTPRFSPLNNYRTL